MGAFYASLLQVPFECRCHECHVKGIHDGDPMHSSFLRRRFLRGRVSVRKFFHGISSQSFSKQPKTNPTYIVYSRYLFTSRCKLPSFFPSLYFSLKENVGLTKDDEIFKVWWKELYTNSDNVCEI